MKVKVPRTERNPRSTSTSEFAGVSWDEARKLWVSSLYIDGNNLYLGGFRYEFEAALVRDHYARKYFGDRAICNFSYSVFPLPKSSDRRPRSEHGKFIYFRWNKYVVQICSSQVRRHIGMYEKLEEAIKVRDEECKKLMINPYKY